VRLAGLLIAAVALLVGRAAPIRANSAVFSPESETEAMLQKILDKHLALTGAPGALVGVWTGAPNRGTWCMPGCCRRRGRRHAGTGRSRAHRQHRKTFIATLSCSSRMPGRDLDDPLESYVPSVLNGDQITIRHLLAR
jgi:hypothetical protein